MGCRSSLPDAYDEHAGRDPRLSEEILAELPARSRVCLRPPPGSGGGAPGSGRACGLAAPGAKACGTAALAPTGSATLEWHQPDGSCRSPECGAATMMGTPAGWRPSTRRRVRRASCSRIRQATPCWIKGTQAVPVLERPTWSAALGKGAVFSYFQLSFSRLSPVRSRLAAYSAGVGCWGECLQLP